ncbi:hypothetical protein [Streptomyces sp. URMC 124]|uniref:hypothetical protein n=1 Tax=Streptomyces sp. URMC 124 TaxID=3423405 RepID=UPI003F19B47A
MVLAGLAVGGFFAAKFILTLVLGLLFMAFSIVAILCFPLMLIGGLARGGDGKRDGFDYDKWCEENDGRGRWHSDSGVPF